MQKIKENTYKVVSASAATLDTIGKPFVKHSHKIMIEGSNDIEDSIDRFLDDFAEKWYSPTKVLPLLKKANSALNKLTRSSISKSYEDYMGVVCSFESFLTQEQSKMEESLNQIGSRVHHDWVFSQENRKTLQELIDLIKSLTQALKPIPYSKLWKYFLTFIALQNLSRGNTHNPSPIISLSNHELESCRNLKYFSHFSTSIYGGAFVSLLIKKDLKHFLTSGADDEVFCEYTQTPPDHLLYSHIKSRKLIPGHCISLDQSSNSIVITLRGTQSLFDCMTDLKSDYDLYEFKDPQTMKTTFGFVHSGIMNSAQELDKEIKSIVLSCLNEWKGFGLVIAGHSLGAGVGTCLALLWASDPLFCTVCIKMYAYAPPPVLSSSLAFVLKDVVVSCVYGNDVVCRLSTGSVKDLAAAILAVEELALAGMLDCDRVCNLWFLNGGKKGVAVEEVQGMKEAWDGIRGKMDNEKLVICGQIFQMFRKGRHFSSKINTDTEDLEYGFYDSDFYNEIILDKTCFLDHMPDTYEDALISIPLDISDYI